MLVGALLVAIVAEPKLGPVLSVLVVFLAVAERLRRIRRHATHARDVQAPRDPRRREQTLSAEAASKPAQLAIDFAYLVTGVCFILGLRYPELTRKRRAWATHCDGRAWLIALIATGFNLNFGRRLAGSCSSASGLGAAVGIYSARAVKMTAMPQMVALFNGAGGGAAAMVATAEFLERSTIRRA